MMPENKIYWLRKLLRDNIALRLPCKHLSEAIPSELTPRGPPSDTSDKQKAILQHNTACICPFKNYRGQSACFSVTFEETPLVQPESTKVSTIVATLQVN